MSKRAPEYAPMCNKHLRFYFANPNRTEFRSYLAQRQFTAVETVIKTLSDSERKWLEAIIPGSNGRDLLDSYIVQNLKDSGASEAEIDRFYRLLRRVNLKIAICLGYAEDNKESIHWTTNF